ncbi:arabinose transporter [Sphingomonas morindae]|uniref:Arabinose transporter n=1 Tax=Sphingomonas morindae TaxID=1541170 RepID=A0ABY4X3S1_9SPHN|nr:arabinose transporter [Sphingomonas morindae]USI71527.1 arabinose transporter [Sphingomonas morindae]
MVAVFLFFASVGMTLPVLPLHVHDRLGFGPFVIGLVAGCQFAAALVSRFWAGRLADRDGPKRAVTIGLIAAMAGSACYLASLAVLDRPVWSVAVLLVGRGLLGGAESLVITGGILWGLTLVAADRSAQVIAWVGMAMFAALAIGAPLGGLVYARFAFTGIALATLALALLALLPIVRLAAAAPPAAPAGRIADVARAVALPGVGFALSGITFGAMTAFLTLLFALHGWSGGPLVITGFAVALIVTRLVGGSLPDRLGGARVATWSLGAQAVGLLVIGTAGSGMVAAIGAVVAGAGFSLVFPSLGLEAVRRARPDQRGLAMGTYNAFLDLTLGLGSPALGWLAAHAGIHSVFLAAAAAALLAIPVASTLRSRSQPSLAKS